MLENLVFDEHNKEFDYADRSITSKIQPLVNVYESSKFEYITKQIKNSTHSNIE